MTKKFITILFAIFFLLFISNKFTTSVQGQVDPGAIAQLWRCLKAEQVGQKSRIPPPEVDVMLTGVGFPSLHDIYVVLCAAAQKNNNPKAPTNYQCTTGNKEYDRLIFNANRINSIAPLSFEVPKGSVPNQKIQAAYGKVDLVSHMSNAEGHRKYAFFGVTINEPKLVSEDQASTIQYATFQFEQDPAKCLSIRWDPYGRVFDSQSLEPISRVRVSLLDRNKQLVMMPGLFNPQTTEADGLYNFFVYIKEGGKKAFYLNPVPLPPLPHTFTATPNLHPNYVKAYSDIYKPDELIIEESGIPEHRDIPLDPGTSSPFRSNPVSMSIASVKIGKFTRYEGSISHPLSIVTLVGKISKNEIARANADKNGDWEILIPNNKIPQNEPLKVEIIKVDLTTLTRKDPNNYFAKSAYKFLLRLIKSALPLINKVSAQDTTPTDSNSEFQPILSYVEGYAYDQSGNIIANATVKVMLDMTDGVYYQTTADENGFFSIAPENLPIFSYRLEFTSPNSTNPVRTSTAEFAQKNQDHLTTNNIDLMAAIKNGESLIPTSPPSPTPIVTNETPAAGRSTFAGNRFNLMLIVIVLIVLLGVAGGILLYLKKKESQTDNLL